MAEGLIKSFDWKLSRERMEALHEMYEYMLGQYIPADNYENLLQVHLVSMMWRLHDALAGSKQRKFTLKVSGPEAMAFLLLWGNEKMDMRRRGAPLICDLIKQIDKEYKGNLYAGNNSYR